VHTAGSSSTIFLSHSVGLLHFSCMLSDHLHEQHDLLGGPI